MMPKKILWRSHIDRRHLPFGATKRVEPSEYFKILSKIGAGWVE